VSITEVIMTGGSIKGDEVYSTCSTNGWKLDTDFRSKILWENPFL